MDKGVVLFTITLLYCLLTVGLSKNTTSGTRKSSNIEDADEDSLRNEIENTVLQTLLKNGTVSITDIIDYITRRIIDLIP